MGSIRFRSLALESHKTEWHSHTAVTLEFLQPLAYRGGRRQSHWRWWVWRERRKIRGIACKWEATYAAEAGL